MSDSKPDITKGFVPAKPHPNMIIDRNYSLTEQADYITNIEPYKKQGFIIEPQGVHQFGYFQIRSWRILYSGSNRY